MKDEAAWGEAAGARTRQTGAPQRKRSAHSVLRCVQAWLSQTRQKGDLVPRVPGAYGTLRHGLAPVAPLVPASLSLSLLRPPFAPPSLSALSLISILLPVRRSSIVPLVERALAALLLVEHRLAPFAPLLKLSSVSAAAASSFNVLARHRSKLQRSNPQNTL